MSRFPDLILRGDRASQPLATAVTEGTLYFVTDESLIERSTGAAWESYSAAVGAGDVIGPAGAIDDRIVTFDGVTGKLVQDGGKTIATVLSDAAAAATADAAAQIAAVFPIDLTTDVTGLLPSANIAAFRGLLDYKFVRKSADTTRTATITATDDPHLTFAIAANEIWIIDYHLITDGPVAGDLRFVLSVPAGATGFLGGLRANGSGTTTTEAAVWSVANDFGPRAHGTVAAGTLTQAQLRAMVVNGGTAGNVVLQWAQFVSDAGNTRLSTNSYLEARRVL